MAANQLTDSKIKKTGPANRQIKLADGDRLQLVIYPSGSKTFRMAYYWNGKPQTYTIGKYPDISLADARRTRDKVNSWLASGKNPKIEHNQERALQSANIRNSFDHVARLYISRQEKSGRKPATISKYWWCLEAVPKQVRCLPVADINGRHAVDICRPIDDGGDPDKARRTHQFMKQVMNYAVDTATIVTNPIGAARYLPARDPAHHPAITDVAEIRHLLKQFESYSGTAVVRFAVQIAAHVLLRPGELRRARWSDISFDQKIWRIPPEHMKTGDPHAVPLSIQVIEYLKTLKEIYPDTEQVFPSPQARAIHLSENAMTDALNRMGYKGVHTAHGFRTTGSTILHASGHFDSLWIEAQLAHIDTNAIRAAYNQADYFEQRRSMMQWYSDKLTTSHD